ncbi:MAG: SpoIIE family protein phosphatase [Bdellovibrionaceae bacterium]|nr:SpoIIE family protein phosphatase [Pseudobdellovibrionaceae bacterium]
MSDESELQQRIRLLEKELENKNRDIEVYRQELAKANVQLEQLIIHIHSQLKKAMEIQRQVVPTEFPNIPGFEFSTKFLASSLTGGDYFDIFEHRDKMRFGVLLTSASGYSLSALFLSLFMKFTFQMRQDEEALSPESLVATLKSDFMGHIGDKDQFHCFYGVMNRRYFRFDYVLFGDIYALHFKQENGTLQRLKPQAMALAKGQLGTVTTQSAQVESKDKIILCSPGLFKIRNDAGELFGEERYLSLVKNSAGSDVHNLRNEVVFQAERFAGNAQFPQDLTVLVLEAKDRVLKLAGV